MTTVVPASLPAQRGGFPWIAVLRGGSSAWLAAVVAVSGQYVLTLLAFVLLPTCTYGDAPLALRAAAAGVLVAAALGPVLVAGARLWWLGVPAAALAVHALMPVCWSVLTETQSGFCF